MTQAQHDGRTVLEGRTASEHLVENHAGAIDVGRRRGRASESELGAHVARCSGDGCGWQLRADLGVARDAEVAHLDAPVGGEQHVGGLDVAMDDALRVRAAEREAQALGDATRLGGGERAGREALGEAFAIDKLGDVIRALASCADVEDLKHAGVVDAREQPGLALETFDPGRVLGPPWLDHLDRDWASESAVDRPIDASEGTLAEHLVELIARVEGAAAQLGGLGHQSRVFRAGRSDRAGSQDCSVSVRNACSTWL